MNLIINIVIALVSFFIGTLITFLLIHHNKEKTILEKDKTLFDEFKRNSRIFEDEKKKYTENKEKELNEQYHKGFDDGFKRAEMNSKIMSLSITPKYDEEKVRGFFKRGKIIKSGYEYQILINGIPCLEPYFKIVNITRIKEISEDNIKLIINKSMEAAELLIKATSPVSFINGNFIAMGQEILKRIHNKKYRKKISG